MLQKQLHKGCPKGYPILIRVIQFTNCLKNGVGYIRIYFLQYDGSLNLGSVALSGRKRQRERRGSA